MFRKLAILPLLFGVLLVWVGGCSNNNKEVTFKPVPEGTPTPAGVNAPKLPKAKPVEDR
jgi:hypothetical protein